MTPQNAPSASDIFNRLAKATSRAAGHHLTFLLAIGGVTLWAVSGPMFGWSQNWQLVINTATTIITFLMVFLIQNTQNRDSVALHLKIDELIRSNKKARNDLLNLEEMSGEQLEEIRLAFRQMADKARRAGDPARADEFEALLSPPNQ